MTLRAWLRALLLLLALLFVVVATVALGYEVYLEVSAGQKARALNAIRERLEELGRDIDELQMHHYEDSMDRKYKEPKR